MTSYRLKRIPASGGLTYTLGKAEHADQNDLICNYCAWKVDHAGYGSCKTYDRMEELRQSGLAIMRRTCPVYQPVLTFKPPLGFYEDIFNTFRLGTAWYHRVSPGTIVGMMDNTTGLIFGKSEVLEVHNGDLEEMCAEHAYMNHLFRGRDPEEAAQQLYDLIVKLYGKYLQTNPTATVVYLENLNLKKL